MRRRGLSDCAIGKVVEAREIVNGFGIARLSVVLGWSQGGKRWSGGGCGGLGRGLAF